MTFLRSHCTSRHLARRTTVAQALRPISSGSTAHTYSISKEIQIMEKDRDQQQGNEQKGGQRPGQQGGQQHQGGQQQGGHRSGQQGEHGEPRQQPGQGGQRSGQQGGGQGQQGGNQQERR